MFETAQLLFNSPVFWLAGLPITIILWMSAYLMLKVIIMLVKEE